MAYLNLVMVRRHRRQTCGTVSEIYYSFKRPLHAARVSLLREFEGDVQGQLGGGQARGVQDCTRTAGAVGFARKRAEGEKKEKIAALLHHSDRVEFPKKKKSPTTLPHGFVNSPSSHT